MQRRCWRYLLIRRTFDDQRVLKLLHLYLTASIRADEGRVQQSSNEKIRDDAAEVIKTLRETYGSKGESQKDADGDTQMIDV